MACDVVERDIRTRTEMHTCGVEIHMDVSCGYACVGGEIRVCRVCALKVFVFCSCPSWNYGLQ